MGSHRPTSRLFTSTRERALWVSAAVVLAGIMATIVLAETLADVAGEPGALDAVFVVGMWLVAAAVVILALRVRPGWLEVGVGVGIAAVYLLLVLRTATAAERTHLIEYSVLAVFVLEALIERARGGRPVRWPAVSAWLISSGAGVIDEVVQIFVPARVFDPIDILFNVLAAGSAVVATVALRRARRLTRDDP